MEARFVWGFGGDRERAQRTELVFLLHEALGQSVEALPPHILHTDYLHTCVTASAHHNTIELRSSRPAPYLPSRSCLSASSRCARRVVTFTSKGRGQPILSPKTCVAFLGTHQVRKRRRTGLSTCLFVCFACLFGLMVAHQAPLSMAAFSPCSVFAL